MMGWRGKNQAMSERQADAVIFDLGGVIMKNGSPRDFTKRYPDHDPHLIAEIMMGPHHLDTDHPWHRVERGEISLAECRALTKEKMDAAGIVAAPATEETGASPARTFEFQLNDNMVTFIHNLKEGGIPIGILTNNVKEFREWWWPLMDFDNIFDTVVDSHEVGIRKPNPAIYHLTMERIGATATRTVFLDDLHANVDAARQLGMHGVLVEEDSTAAITTARHLTQIF